MSTPPRFDPRASLPARRTVVVATTNRGKLRELRAMLAVLPIDLVTPSDILGRTIDVVEDGATFEVNAEKKALAVACATTLPTLADDSGLEVDALDGRPGVRSARFAGERATDAENNRKLLHELEALGHEAVRTARFRCAVVFVDPAHLDVACRASGACEGAIAPIARGTGGFGYDPIFVVDAAAGRTMAELDDAAKSECSHRAHAIAALLPSLRAWLAR